MNTDSIYEENKVKLNNACMQELLTLIPSMSIEELFALYRITSNDTQEMIGDTMVVVKQMIMEIISMVDQKLTAAPAAETAPPQVTEGTPAKEKTAK